MSASNAALGRSTMSANSQATPSFALPLDDRAADLEESALLKVGTYSAVQFESLYVP